VAAAAAVLEVRRPGAQVLLVERDGGRGEQGNNEACHD
jgi:hypothetical protein